MKDEMKVIKLLQQGTNDISSSHKEINDDIEHIKRTLLEFQQNGVYFDKESIPTLKSDLKKSNTKNISSKKNFSEIVDIANKKIPEEVGLKDILTDDDLLHINKKVHTYIDVFNKKHQLDAWDYAISGGTGLFCAILDVLFIRKPAKPTASYSNTVNGLFNQWSQKAINTLIPPELSTELEKIYKIGGTDASTSNGFIATILERFNPTNHRLKALSHDPVLAFIIGTLDVKNGTCTIIDNGSIKVLETVKGTSGHYNFFQALGKILGHLASDINAPSAKGNRGMGIPAPLMGLFGILQDVEINNQDIDKLVEYMYVNGYDARHFVTMSIPVLINEVLIRVLYIVKEMKYNKRDFVDIFKETLPLNLSHRFRMILNLSYGTMVAVNAGKVAITKDILNANYTMWMVFTWHTFHSLRWLLLTKNRELQEYIDTELVNELKELNLKIDELSKRAELL
ncbi:MAG: hypothetical protein KAH77_06690 [Thiomargarita sp.]|nr:hypothetical protein [Thiomargarita sp.]